MKVQYKVTIHATDGCRDDKLIFTQWVEMNEGSAFQDVFDTAIKEWVDGVMKDIGGEE